MTKNKKIILGILSFWPLIWFFLFFFFFFSLFASIITGSNSGAMFLSSFFLIFIGQMITIFLILGLEIYYIYHSVKNKKMSDDSRIMWIIGLFILGPLVFPFYWYNHIWKLSTKK